jgi:D-threo-aldose 1-dehydrogenase
VGTYEDDKVPAAEMNECRPIAHDIPHPSEDQRPRADPVLGFGCASLYGLPTKHERRAVLESAYEFGIRHFDVAPIYGLGVAETELAEFIGNRTDIRVATKFGIRPTVVGRLAGLAQAPIRRMLKSSPAMKAKVKNSGAKPNAGIVGRMLYTSHDYSVANAQEALAASLRALRVDRMDYFLLHEPVGTLGDNYHCLVDFLERERSKGTIGQWGPAGDLSHMDEYLRGLIGDAGTCQFPYDLIDGYRGPAPEHGRDSITFGFISASLPDIRGVFERDPGFRTQCSELLDADLADERTALGLLVRDAVTHNEFGTVLVSSTKVSHLQMVCRAANAPLRNEAEVANMIQQKCHESNVQ